jgi:hypothetical protein
MPSSKLASSFRDPSGFVFVKESVLFRQVNGSYQSEFDLLMSSGLYEELSTGGLLIPHEDVGLESRVSEDAVAVIRPEPIPLISYPYEWCFSQFRDAALLTLGIQKRALARGLSLKDASAFNVQFYKGRPIFIDTLSFEKYREGSPWVAYRQFCQHFLAPLVLMSLVDPRMNKALRTYVDGIPLELASRLCPFKSRFNLAILMHIHLHAKAQVEITEPRPDIRERKISKASLLGIIDSLEGLVKSLRYKPEGTVWADYYSQTNYTEEAMSDKRRLVQEFIDEISPKPRQLWDLGANTGEFSRIASAKGIDTVAWDLDPAATELCYVQQTKTGDPHLLPLVQDLTNPSPALGWAHRERESFANRGPVDALLALALIHHLAIGNNVPLGSVSSFFSSLGKWLIIEFVPKSDSQVQRLLSSRDDIYKQYNQTEFERDFKVDFEILRKQEIRGTERTLYLMKRHLET